MSSSKPLVYLILGTPGAGRRAIVRDLVENGLAEEERAVLLLADDETADPADAAIAEDGRIEVKRWSWQAPGFPSIKLDAGSNAFLLADPRVAVVEQIEALKPWLESQGAELGRIVTVVDCQFASEQPALRPWFDACIHFSDVVLLNRREGVENKWLSDFIRNYTGQFYPCHFLTVKKGTIENPALVLEPQPRRVSQYFDAEEPGLGDVEIEGDDDEEGEEDATPTDPYIERTRGGRRVKDVPDLRDFLRA